MTLGPLMFDLRGPQLQPEEKEMLLHPLTGGVILFSRNFESAEQLASFSEEIHKLRTPRLLIAVDHEGGRVQRFREGFTLLPAVTRLGEIYDNDVKKAKQLAEQTGWLMAIELRAVGVDFSFAPVLDVDRGVSTVIGDRAFHKNPQVIAELAHAYMHGMQKSGMAAVGKHFPGHGNVEADTHTDIAIDRRGYADISSEDLVPFERMVRYGLPAIMTAHVQYSEVDPLAATFSRFWLREVLRKRLEFQGVIFSDDLSMHAAKNAGSMSDRAAMALDAGCDMVLVCNDPGGAALVLDELGDSHDAASHMRLVRLHGTRGMTLKSLRRDQQWSQTVRKVLEYDRQSSLDVDV
ncbi:MAG: beta-N-acetylhexosaminidase [Gammaproteobacteria bacterium]|nr:MAG: beta-N-acetylhexosaminidase [Gammaproteobacteria bacterium]